MFDLLDFRNDSTFCAVGDHAGCQYALAALGDGQLFTFIVDPETGCLRDRKKISLGSQPITLSQFQSKGQRHVFAASDRPTVIHTSNGKLIYSNVNLKEVTHMCPFNYEDEALALVTEGSLKVGTVEAIEKLHIKKIPLGETARRITHQEKSGTFGVLTLRIVQNEETGDEEETGYLKLLDDQSFEVLDQFAMDTFENVQSIVSTEFTGDQKTYYCVGTAYVLPQEDEPSKGRILVFDVTEERRLRLVHEQETRGCVYCMASLGGKLLAGINSKAQLFKWEVADDGITMSLVERATHHGHILVLTIAVRGDFVLIGDLMKSVSVLSYNAGDDSLELIARDPDANWMTAVEALDDDVYIGAEDHSNLFALRRRSEAQVEEDRRRLESFGWFHLGEQVNRLRHGSLVMSLPDNEAVATPVLLYCTVNGGIGVVATLDDSTFRLLLDVQDNLRRIVKGVGGLAYTEWRRFENRRRTMNAESFLDGDLIESYLDLTREQQQAVVDGMRLPRDGHRDGHGMKKLDIKVEELTRMVEELTRIH
ncbi:uncharacterized protein SPPG_09532 [Spizellomyces punctatus DAOM BR117]|uniref:DNA damage-binding protein 1 n=1 Tax=Spizellomyces punctatus (strain DAOM BR117) TaxID=645134 RepID=A0A0L0H5B2_SPIPD|nr:uncharacterized protein SPPG_09532 [Spizellomyces punctatus DAOM BR117]KNC96412.1 hypothetical protein SPPG_09532 [Spizellomyces punctatus DAOM BR117]|eukprot:XP_016604452.1 hypothetical protein SPPG_09532 [Spizellomyces punctatus DAOM BR117]